MKTLKFVAVVTATIFLSTGVLSVGAANKTTAKTTAKTQYTKKTYNKSQKKKSTTVQTKEYKVAGLQAWTEAKRNGFQFSPNTPVYGQSLEGTSSKGYSYFVSNNRKCDMPDQSRAHTLGGTNMILYRCKTLVHRFSTYAYFNLFFGKKLKSGWKIKSMSLSSNAKWTSEKWSANTNKIATKIKLTNLKDQNSATTAQLKNIILIGPKNGRWQDAFDVM